MRKLTICGTNVAEYTIVLKAFPDPAEKTAAEFLQKVIEVSCGVKLPISTSAENGIYIGTREASPDIKWDGFRIMTDDKNLYLDGNIPRGTLYAAYDFAEKDLGYRFFTPEIETFSTEGEGIFPANCWKIENPVFEARRSVCCNHLRSGPFSAWGRLNNCMPTGEELGGNIDLTGECHTFYKYVNADEYYDEHPEYFALYNGERIPCKNGGGPGQLCLTNPDVIRITIEKVRKELREKPDTRVIELSQADGAKFCQCDRCREIYEREGSQAGPLLYYVNAVAEAIEEEFPNTLIRTFAYEDDTRRPPKTMRARDNVMIRYCTYEACFRHAIDDPNCEINSSTIRREMEDWQKITKQMSIWDYAANWNCYLTPFPNLISLRENMRYYAECKAIHIITDSCSSHHSGGVYPELVAYLMAKLMWDPYMVEEEYCIYIAEFLQAYYGKGWREIADYMRMEYAMTANRCFTCKEEIDICFIHLESPDVSGIKGYWRSIYEAHPYQPVLPNHALTEMGHHVSEAIACFDRAMELAETDEQRTRIDRSRMALDYLALICMPHNKAEMTAEEQKEYEAAVALFKEKKKKYNLKYNLHTSNLRGE